MGPGEEASGSPPAPIPALRPNARLHQVHPAIGVERRDDGVTELGTRELGMDWLVLSHEEQRARERDVLAELLAYLREHGASTAPEPGATDALMRARWDEPVLIVERGRTLLESSGPLETGVWVAPSDAPALQARLMDAWWASCQARAGDGAHRPTRDGGRLSRRTRAHILVSATSVGRIAYFGALLVAYKVLHLGWWTLALALLMVIASAAVEEALAAWYRRS